MLTSFAAFGKKDPVNGANITSYYGWRTLYGRKEFHTGIDFTSSTGDKRVFAVESGTVIEVIDKYRSESCKKNKALGYANVIKIQMSDGSLTQYLILKTV